MELKTDTQENVKSAKYWLSQLELSEREHKTFVERGKKTVERYKDIRPATASSGQEPRYNILWSNVRTMYSACYSRLPQVVVERRHKDKDPVARCAAMILERALTFDINFYPDFGNALSAAILDRLLPGRGVAWVRYKPEFEESAQITDDDTEEGGEDEEGQPPEGAQPEAVEYVSRECCPADYVYWEDFRCSPARTWEEVTWVARRVYMTKEEGIERFGEDFKQVPLTHMPKGIDNDSKAVEQEKAKKAQVWEIWYRHERQAIWVAESYQYILDERPDPLELEGFFPCPKPIFATLTTDSIVPVADYVQYQDQAAELDDITGRIHKLVKACRVVGVYAGSSTAVKRMLDEGVDNQLIPVENWMEHAERGGLSRLVDFLPLDQVVKALAQLYVAEQEVKAKIYEITGLSDIIRGASNAAETATAQQIKANYAGLRLKDTTNDIARFATEILQRKAQIMASFYSDETLLEMSGIAQTNDGQYAQQALELIRNEPMSAYRIEVSADSMVAMDEQAEQQSRVQFLDAAGNFLQKIIPAAQATPELGPLMSEMLMFGVRSFKAGRDLEAVFESTIETMRQKAEQAKQQPPQPSPDQIKAQLEQQKMQADAANSQSRAKLDQMKAQLDEQRLQMEQQKMQMDAQDAERQRQHEQMMAGLQQGFDRWKSELDAATRIETAQISAEKMIDPEVDAIVDQELAQDIRPET